MSVLYDKLHPQCSIKCSNCEEESDTPLITTKLHGDQSSYYEGDEINNPGDGPYFSHLCNQEFWACPNCNHWTPLWFVISEGIYQGLFTAEEMTSIFNWGIINTGFNTYHERKGDD